MHACLCMPDSTVLALVFEVIMSQRHWVKAPLHTQHIYTALHEQQCLCLCIRLCLCAYVFILDYVCMYVLFVFDCVFFLYAVNNFAHVSRFIYIHLKGFEPEEGFMIYCDNNNMLL